MPGDSRETVLVISPSLGIGGREKIAINTVRSFEGLGYHSVLVFFQRRNTEYPFQGEWINLNIPAQKNAIGRIIAQLRRAVRLLRLRKRYNAQLVFSLGEAANIANVLSSFTHRGKTIIAIHGFGEVKRNLVNSFVFRKADRIVCIAQDIRYQLLQLYPNLRNTVVIENGYEFQALAPSVDKRKTACGLHLISMGRLTQVKGFERLIKSVASLRTRIPDTQLMLIGDGEQKAMLSALARQLGIEESVHFAGFQADPFPWLREADIYALTSFAEGFPNALIEALNCGLPIVAADCRSGPREILSAAYTPEPVRGIKHEKYGVLVEESADGFEERFAEAVLQLWNNKKEMAYYRETAPQRAKDFSLERYQEKLKKLLDDCGYESTQ